MTELFIILIIGGFTVGFLRRLRGDAGWGWLLYFVLGVAFGGCAMLAHLGLLR